MRRSWIVVLTGAVWMVASLAATDSPLESVAAADARADVGATKGVVFVDIYADW